MRQDSRSCQRVCRDVQNDYRFLYRSEGDTREVEKSREFREPHVYRRDAERASLLLRTLHSHLHLLFFIKVIFPGLSLHKQATGFSKQPYAAASGPATGGKLGQSVSRLEGGHLRCGQRSILRATWLGFLKVSQSIANLSPRSRNIQYLTQFNAKVSRAPSHTVPTDTPVQKMSLTLAWAIFLQAHGSAGKPSVCNTTATGPTMRGHWFSFLLTVSSRPSCV